MRRIIGGLVVLMGGCCSMEATRMGWDFHLTKPAAVMTPAVVSPQMGQYAISPIAAYPASPPGAPTAPYRLPYPGPIEEAPMPQAAPMRQRMPAGDNCTCEQILQRLDGIDRRLDSLATKRKCK